MSLGSGHAATSFQCRRISAEDCVPLRSQVLRPNHPLSESRFPLDGISVHFGAFRGGDLISVVSAHPENKFGGLSEWRIRGMATDPSVQGQGAGGILLQTLLAWGRTEGVPLFWCNARETAIVFYERHGFTVESALFDIAGVGPHKVMKRAP